MIGDPHDWLQPARHAVDHRLRHVGDHGEAAGHVAVERAVADRQLRLVAGRQQQRAALVRQRHQQVAADARLDVLFGDVARRCRRRRRAGVSSIACIAGSIGSVSVSIPRLRRERQRVVDAAAARERRRHQHAEHVIGAERLDGDRRGQRRVDAARQAEHGAREAALARVVARAEHQRAPDLRLDVDVVGDGVERPAAIEIADRRRRRRTRGRGRSARRRRRTRSSGRRTRGRRCRRTG